MRLFCLKSKTIEQIEADLAWIGSPAAAPTTAPDRPGVWSGKSWRKMYIPPHIGRMTETPRRLLEVAVVARDDSWEWQVQSQGTVLVSGTGRTRLLARFLGNDARLRLLAEDFGNL